MARSRNKTQINVQLDAELAEILRDAAYWMPGENVSSLVEEAVAVHLGTLEQRLGGEIPKRPDGTRIKPGPLPH